MIVMPITTDAVAVSKKAVNKFIETDEYRKCENADLIFAEFLNVDGSKLFLFEPNRVFQVNENEIDEEEFIWVSIDDEDNLAVMGQWQEFPFNFNISTQMSIIVDDKSKVEYLIKSFDYSIIEDKAFSKICKDFMDSSLEFDDWYDETINQKALDRILKKHNQEIWNGTLEDLMKSSHEINFFKDTGFDCSNSTNSTFIGVFEPDLKQLIKYKSIIEDIIEDLPLGEKVLAYSTFDTYNYELIETLAEKETKVTGSGFDVRITGLSSSVVLNKVALLIKKTIGIGLKEAKDLLNGFQYRRRYAGVDNFLEIQKDIVKSDAIDFKTKLEEIGVQVKIVASTNATKPYINVGLDELISHPSINAYGFSGSGNNGWDGELELDKKGVSLVSLKS
jgi:ribosomal protein L7/L12